MEVCYDQGTCYFIQQILISIPNETLTLPQSASCGNVHCAGFRGESISRKLYNIHEYVFISV